MKVRFSNRSARVLGLCIVVGLVTQAMAVIYPFQPSVPPLPSNCNQQWVIGTIGNNNSGCVGTNNCTFLEPNQGILWSLEYYCCYNSAGTLSGTQGPWCVWQWIDGCCNDIDLNSHCPSWNGATCPVTGP